MADRVLMICWNNPVRGREERGLEVFNEAVGLCGRMQEEGRIEKFDVVLLGPNALMDGCVTIYGSAEQLAAMRDDEEFKRNTYDAQMIVDGLCHIDGVANEGVAREMALYQEAVARTPQMA
jgi:hypothetical protein